MGLFWDLLQQNQIDKQQRQAATLEERVGALETELRETRQTLHEVIRRLENAVGKDLDQDGRIG
jgi:phosphopantetheine adenylyltransferase